MPGPDESRSAPVSKTGARSGTTLTTIRDADDRPAAEVRGHEQFKSAFSVVHSDVISIEPFLQGPLWRRSMVTPMVLAQMRSSSRAAVKGKEL